MCYAKPGPRCSKHATENLKKALASRDAEKIKKAKEEYLLTPAGIDKLMSEGKVKQAQKASEHRKELIRLSKRTTLVMKYVSEEVERAFGSIVSKSGRNYVKETMDLINDYKSKYGTPVAGRTRVVFDRGDGYMLKIPINDEGYMASSNEVFASQQKDPYVPIAHCHYDETRPDDAVPVLIMEKVTPDRRPWRDQPEWVGSVDSAQVGFTKEGKLVAYDL